jgi:hypothetical protein
MASTSGPCSEQMDSAVLFSISGLQVCRSEFTMVPGRWAGLKMTDTSTSNVKSFDGTEEDCINRCRTKPNIEGIIYSKDDTRFATGTNPTTSSCVCANAAEMTTLTTGACVVPVDQDKLTGTFSYVWNRADKKITTCPAPFEFPITKKQSTIRSADIYLGSISTVQDSVESCKLYCSLPFMCGVGASVRGSHGLANCTGGVFQNNECKCLSLDQASLEP